MATLDTTVGGASANSYSSVEYADGYLIEQRLNASAWDSVTNKVAALIMATYQLDRLSYIGTKATTAQALQWPRADAYLDGVLIGQANIPPGLPRATAELAFWLSQDDRTVLPSAEQIEQLKVGPIDLKFRDPPGSGGIIASLPDVVIGHLRGLVRGGISHGGSGFRKVLRA